MSNIPSSAIPGALTPVQRATNEALRARKIQSDKNFHHSEEVDELDDTAVNSVNDQSSGGQGKREKGDPKRQDLQEQVDIATLPSASLELKPSSPAPSRLDISA